MVDAPASPDEAVVQELREAGLRVTMARQAVLTWLALHPHSTADAIAGGVREQFGALSLQAIYGVLAAYATAACCGGSSPPGIPPGSSGGSGTTITTWCAGGAVAPRISTAWRWNGPAWNRSMRWVRNG